MGTLYRMNATKVILCNDKNCTNHFTKNCTKKYCVSLINILYLFIGGTKEIIIKPFLVSRTPPPKTLKGFFI